MHVCFFFQTMFWEVGRWDFIPLYEGEVSGVSSFHYSYKTTNKNKQTTLTNCCLAACHTAGSDVTGALYDEGCGFPPTGFVDCWGGVWSWRGESTLGEGEQLDWDQKGVYLSSF